MSALSLLEALLIAGAVLLLIGALVAQAAAPSAIRMPPSRAVSASPTVGVGSTVVQAIPETHLVAGVPVAAAAVIAVVIATVPVPISVPIVPVMVTVLAVISVAVVPIPVTVSIMVAIMIAVLLMNVAVVPIMVVMITILRHHRKCQRSHQP